MKIFGFDAPVDPLASLLGLLRRRRNRRRPAPEERTERESRFAADVFHELRTPLSLILGPLEDILAGRHGELRDGLKKQNERMLRNARRLAALVDQLLDLSLLGSGCLKLSARRGELVGFVRQCVLSFAPLAERKGVMLGYWADGEPIQACFDADKLEKALANLLSNAIKFTPEKGKILVTLLEENEDWLRIVVKDTGTGIPPEALPRVFDRFYRRQASAPDAAAGAGIGLSLAQELVRLHGGEIHAASVPGYGSEFTVRLPVGAGRLNGDRASGRETGAGQVRRSPERSVPVVNLSATDSPPASVEPGQNGHNPAASTVLVVEDHGETRAYLRERLQASCRVLEAEDGKTGLQIARNRLPDLVISDVVMPGVDGHELCRVLKTDKRTGHIPVILLTARASDESRIEGLATGADDYLVKPFRACELAARVENLIETRRKLRDRYSRKLTLQPSRVEATSCDQAFLKKAAALVDAHLGEKQFDVYAFASEMGLSRRQLHRKIKALTGQGPAQLIRDFRLKRAASLLEQRAGTVAEIAYAVGFQKPRHFSDLFRARFGRNPSEYAC